MNTDIRLSTEFWDHPKTVKLERRLGLQGPKSLQILWMWAAKYHADGRLEGEDVEAIEIAAKWPGNESTFVNSLVELRWLDKDGDTFCLHDWREHNAWAAEADSRSDKSRLSRMAKTHPDLFKKLVSEGKNGISRDEYESLTTVERSSNDRKRVLQAQGPLPSPSPTPSPKEKDTIAHPTRSERDFETFWQAYPRKKSKGHAQKTWDKLRKNKLLPELTVLLGAIAAAKAGQDWQRDGGKFIPHPSTWLSAMGWEDESVCNVGTSSVFAGAL